MFNQFIKKGNKKNENFSPSAQEFCCSLKNRKIINLIFYALFLFLAVLVVSKIIDIKDKIQNPATKNTINVSDKGVVYVRPDLAVANFSVITEAKTAPDALGQNTVKMNAVIDAVKQLGVEEKDLKTINFNIAPRYEWSDPSDIGQGKRILAGYEATQSLEIKIRKLEKTGDIVQAATASGANEAGNLQFTVENQEEAKSQARAEAIEKAMAKAKDLTSQLGVKLGKVVYFNESGSVPYYFTADQTLSPGKGGESPEMQTGENKIEVTVTITYEIR